jgi:NTE family protein
MTHDNDSALVLSGGGARGAYQAGAIRALYEVGKEVKSLGAFRNLVGVSAGAINAAYLAAEADDLDRATDQLCKMWKTLHSKNVFQTDYVTVGRTALRLARAISLGGFSDRLRPTQAALLNIDPLKDLLAEKIRFDNIPRHISNHNLNSICITATDYSTSTNVTFFAGTHHLHEWKRVQRMGIRTKIGIDHVLASAAIPLFFPPWPIGNRHYGDGCLRNSAPLAPARRVGASKVIVVGVRNLKDESLNDQNIVKPTLGRVLSVVINAILMDAIDVDIERVRILNEKIEVASKTDNLRKIDILYLRPSQAPSALAEIRAEALPPMLRFLMSGLGSAHESSEILSYLVFDPVYLSALVDLGYHDVMKQKDILKKFLTE